MEGKIKHALKEGSKYEAQRVLRELLFDIGKVRKNATTRKPQKTK